MDLFLRFLIRVCLLSTLFLADFCKSETSRNVYFKECQGSSTDLSHSAGSQTRYDFYRNMYSNCTLVTLNLEIVFLELADEQYDLSFLENIREVNGYVLIYGNFLSKIRLNRLRVIRGFTLYESQGKEFSLYVSRNAFPGNASIGLKELQLTSLTEILRGDVLFSNNRRLCFGENTINWGHIMNGRIAEILINQQTSDGYNKVSCQDQGLSCHENCTAGDGHRYCWGPGADMCQPVCSDCGSNRCVLGNKKSCCHKECIAGCNHANDESQCLSCKSYGRSNGASCVHSCSSEVYNEHTGSIETPEDKYIQGSKCVKQCDKSMVLQDGRCSFNCRRGFMENKENSRLRECIPCLGDCPITCDGTKEWIHREILLSFTNCVKVKGKLSINTNSFTDHFVGGAIVPDDLEILSTVEEITGSLEVEAHHQDFISLNFLRNLRIIGGTAADGLLESRKGLFVYQTSLRSLELNALESVMDGWITIASNPDLCFVEASNWTSLRPKQNIRLRGNKNSSYCENEGFTCSSTCLASDGCMGPGNHSCITCPHFYQLDRTCSSDCSTQELFYVKEGIRGNKECRPCDKECKGGCNGDGPYYCHDCQHVRHHNVCVVECPSQMYPDVNSVCQPCNSVCNECTGNSTVLGLNGCRDCANKTIRYDDQTSDKAPGHCITSEEECNETYFKKDEGVPIYLQGDNTRTLMRTCRKCHAECVGCTGPMRSQCHKCRNYNQIDGSGLEECVATCSSLFYDSGYSHCLSCHPECLQCFGETEYDCHVCKNVRIDPSLLTELTEGTVGNDTSHKTFCAEECPKGLVREKAENSTEKICAVSGIAASIQRIAVPIIVVLVIIIVVVVIVLGMFWRKQKLRRLRENILATNLIPIISATKAKPDMSLLRLIKESELRRGNVIGSGAFGTVYKGIWIPDKENVKIPVAIKVLQETSNTNLNVELLDEARIMASVCHPYCVRILAVCMTAQMMLITQLMPLGCLLDYVRKEKSNIGSRALLLWSVQIAQGMKYLEELGIVHRDLAARNVLVHNPNQVKITDFGLSKLLDYEEAEIHSEGGKMPIKWLALESIMHRIYTHKSDVWSYGVTLWEIFTYGCRPYEDLQARQVPQALEKGERLPQPTICTIDVYMILIKCWMLDVESRPTFADLSIEFTRMASDPGRFLVIPGDSLMRLPSQGPNASDLIRLMSLPVDEPDFKVMSGDEYLRPMDLEGEGNDGFCPQGSSLFSPLTSIPERGSYANSESSEMDERGGKPSVKLSHQDSFDPIQRYTAEPFRSEHGQGVHGNDVSTGNTPVFRTDENGYLPPQSIADQQGYLEIPDQDSKNTSPNAQVPQQYLDMSTNMGSSRDNFEYFDNEAAPLTDNTKKTNKASANIFPDKANKDSEYCNVMPQPGSYKRLPE